MQIRPIDGNALADKIRTRMLLVDDPTVLYILESVRLNAMNADELSLNTLRDEIYEDAVKHGLWESHDYTVKLALEDAEADGDPCDPDEMNRCWAMELIRKEVNELEMASESEAEYAEELADVIIMSLSVAGRLGIDIDAAVRRKMEINKKRPWKHGKE